MFVTQPPPDALTLPAFFEGMKVHVWDHEASGRLRAGEVRPAQRKTVAQILRAAYNKHVRDRHTRQAVKRCLR